MRILSRFALSFLFTSFCALITFAQTPSPDMPRLTNKEIVGMVKAGVSDEVIIAKIKVSRCNFDTEPSVLAELKQQGISNQVLMAMVQAPYGAPAKVKEAERLPPESQDGKPTGESAQSTSAQDMTVFGIPLGQQFTVPECEHGYIGYKGGIRSVCFERLHCSERSRTLSCSITKWDKKQVPEPVLNETVMIQFPLSEVLEGNPLAGLILNGKLEGVGFNTLGVSNADSVLQRLTTKYGRPTTLVSKKVQTRLGASFDALEASWAFPNLYVTFDSAFLRIDSGFVNIDTKIGKEHRERELKELLKDKRPL